MSVFADPGTPLAKELFSNDWHRRANHFPRRYFLEECAKREAEAWLEDRGQLVEKTAGAVPPKILSLERQEVRRAKWHSAFAQDLAAARAKEETEAVNQAARRGLATR